MFCGTERKGSGKRVRAAMPLAASHRHWRGSLRNRERHHRANWEPVHF
jgi:hypothetical protein